MYKCIKSVADVFFALIALAITAPLMLVCAIIVRCDGRGKALFRQERIGKGGKTFFIYKFRTMTATDISFATDHAVIEDGNPSVTKAGRILRKFKLDELPQLFNVLRGEMSFVGPRPLMPVYLDEYEEWEKQKFAVKPGLTGLAQVNGNGYLEKKSRSYYDVFYVENESLFLDVKIFFKTFLIVLFGEEKFLREVDEKEIKEAEIRFDSRKTEGKSPQVGQKVKELADNEKRRFNLLYTMVARNVRTIYRDSVLGIVWTVLNPLLTMLVLSFVYSNVFGRAMENIKYPVYILSGMLVFNTFFRNGTTMALTSIVDKRALVMQTRLPVTVYPRVSVYTAAVNTFFGFVALAIVMLIYGQPFKPTLAYSVVAIPGTFLFTMGASYILATVYVYFRDVRNLYGVFVTLLNFITPIYYTADALGNAAVTKVLKYNPLYYYVDFFRQTIIGNLPSPEHHLIIYGFGLLVFAIGYLAVNKGKKSFVFHL